MYNMFTKEWIEEILDEVTCLSSIELKQKFINQIFDYINNCCETEQEALCFIDGLLINLY